MNEETGLELRGGPFLRSRTEITIHSALHLCAFSNSFLWPRRAQELGGKRRMGQWVGRRDESQSKDCLCL